MYIFVLLSKSTLSGNIFDYNVVFLSTSATMCLKTTDAAVFSFRKCKCFSGWLMLMRFVRITVNAIECVKGPVISDLIDY